MQPNAGGGNVLLISVRHYVPKNHFKFSNPDKNARIQSEVRFPNSKAKFTWHWTNFQPVETWCA